MEKKMQYFNSNGDIHEIDPDIATDLERFSSWYQSLLSIVLYDLNKFLLQSIDLNCKI